MENENIKSQLKKGLLEYCILQIISQKQVYSSEILDRLIKNRLIVVEGTLYPLLSRLRRQGLVLYKWQETKKGPPRKYYLLTSKGKEKLLEFKKIWKELSESINLLLIENEQKLH